jgi:membrane protein YqaA with SNARE-associated domain
MGFFFFKASQFSLKNYKELLIVSIYTLMGSSTEYVIGYFVGEPIKETYIFLMDISIENTLVIFTNKFGDRY